MADLVVAPSRIHGLGVIAARDLRVGETVFRIDDLRLKSMKKRYPR